MPKGYILLEGGAEFGGKMAEPDRRAIELAGGWDAPISILPTAAAPDANHHRAGQNGVRWFSGLGAQQVHLSLVIDRRSAGDPALAAALRAARLIYMLGGFPDHLAKTLAGSLCWQAILEAYQSGAVIGGSSAGAMVLCEHYYNPHTQDVAAGLGLVPNACILPHHDTFGKGWAAALRLRLPEALLIGIDEQTGMLDDGTGDSGSRWSVYGKGAVTLYGAGWQAVYQSGESLALWELPW